MLRRVGDKELYVGEARDGLLGGVVMRNFDVRRFKRVIGLGREAGLNVCL